MANVEDRRWLVQKVDAVNSRRGSVCFIAMYILGFFLVALLTAKVFAAGSLPYRFVAGMFFGAYAMGGRTAARYLWLNYRYKKITPLDALLLCPFLIFLGLGTWFIGWEGAKTGVAFGLGVFISITCYQLSIGEFYDRAFNKEIIEATSSVTPQPDETTPPEVP
ncbi:hypothetical protein LJN55_09340 [Erwinia rhapontici]|uniref:hypothetical protein n=1 Tax=Erwinia rhapontici TaxID=55212 RepID=UPI001D0DA3E4|nr:hypothetical protein [Erwinia rhapontici]UDQ82014.1 hypothetical protein LJN55_09340 [Erwinia rhapontici]